jgi:hypothetical protein
MAAHLTIFTTNNHSCNLCELVAKGGPQLPRNYQKAQLPQLPRNQEKPNEINWLNYRNYAATIVFPSSATTATAPYRGGAVAAQGWFSKLQPH